MTSATHHQQTTVTRRRFLKGGLLTAATFGFQIVPRRVLGGEGFVPPSRKLNIASIGAGCMGFNGLQQMSDENIVAICDVDDIWAAKSFATFPQARRYRDFRVMLDEMDSRIDAVAVATPDHIHAVAAMAAMQRGKQVYCEKPLAHTVAELRALREEAKRRGLVTQMGNQGHAFDEIRIFCEWIWDGAIGNVTEVHAGCYQAATEYYHKSKLAKVRAERPPVRSSLDWTLWQGPVPERAYHPLYLPCTWRGWSAYGSGAIGDMWCHMLDPVFWALDLDMPTTIWAECDDYDPEKDGDVFPDGAKVTFEFAAKGKRPALKIVWFDGTCKVPRPPELEPGRELPTNSVVVSGDRGKILHGSHGAGGLRLIPETAMQAYKRPKPKLARVRGGHRNDWLNAIRDGKQAGSPFEYGGRLSEIALLGAIAIRTGEKLHYDEQKMCFTNSAKATAMLNPPYRQGWKLQPA